jgi:integrase
MNKRQFVRVGECLYRYALNGDPYGSYYAYFWRGDKQVKQSLETDDRPLAKRKLADLLKDYERLDLGQRKVSFAEIINRYEKTLTIFDPNTVISRKAILKRLRATWAGDIDAPISQIKPSAVSAWVAQERQRVRTATLNEYKRVLRKIFELAVKDGVIPDSPARDLKESRREDPIRETPTWEEFEAIVKAIRGNPFSDTADVSADFVDFLGRAGLGNAEAAGLKWKDVDFKKNQLRLYRHKTDTGFFIPIYPQVRELLERLHKVKEHKPDDKVFQIADAKKSLATACKALGYPHYTHRAFRRMFVTRAIEKGIDVKVIAEWQGHRDGGKLILQTYSHVRRPHMEEMALRMKE